jgi:hypothetical protein
MFVGIAGEHWSVNHGDIRGQLGEGNVIIFLKVFLYKLLDCVEEIVVSVTV